MSTTRAGAKRKSNPSFETLNPIKRSASKCHEINPNICCMCFSTYEEDMIDEVGTDWISCAYGWWLHEDCAEDRELNDDGQERFCPYCIV